MQVLECRQSWEEALSGTESNVSSTRLNGTFLTYAGEGIVTNPEIDV